MRVCLLVHTLSLVVALGLPAAPATACPVCHTEGGATVRAGIFNAAFPSTLLEVLAPFAGLGVALGLLNRCLPD